MADQPTKVPQPPAAPAQTGRRIHPRYPFTAAVQAVDTRFRTVLNARISDLGRGGCYIDAFSPFPLKSSVKLRITNEMRSFEAHANVIYSKTGMGMGLQFTAIEPEQLTVLDKWLAELSGASPPSTHTAAEPNGHAPAKESLNDEQCYALIERTIAMIREGSLTNAQGKAMLRNLLRQPPHS
jgi:hypothetical protein